MRIPSLLRLTPLLLALACGGSNTDTSQETGLKGLPDSATVFSIIPVLQQQVDYLGVVKKQLICYTTRNGQSDSATVNKQQLQALADHFLSKDISAVKGNYTENIFSDASTGSVTISYTAIDETVPVRSLDILLDENSRLAKRIFIKYYQQKKDTTIQEQYSWFMNHGLQINRSVKAANGYALEERKEVKWDQDPE